MAVKELEAVYTKNSLVSILEDLLIYGQYPRIFKLASKSEKEDYLFEVTESYLFKDVLNLTNIRKSGTLYRLLQLLAYQIGSEVSASELSNSLDLDKKTVLKYLDLLEQTFVIYSLPAFSRNKRKEVSKSRKYYFWDLGIRNALIKDFRILDLRNDVGGIWENFIVNERIKLAEYLNLRKDFYFWRTYWGSEIDLVEQSASELIGFEIKFGTKRVKPPKLWTDLYPQAKFYLINKQNWIDWVG